MTAGQDTPKTQDTTFELGQAPAPLNTTESGATEPREELPEQEEKTTRETLKCYLTQDERDDLTNQMVTAVQAKEQAEADLSAVKKQFQKDIAAQDAIIKSTSQKLSNNYEMRLVECKETHDFQNHTVTTIRTDTGETVRTQTMTADELQRRLL